MKFPWRRRRLPPDPDAPPLHVLNARRTSTHASQQPPIKPFQPTVRGHATRLPLGVTPDVVMTQVKLIRRTTPDDDEEMELLQWLARRGFHDVVAVTTIHRSSEGQDGNGKRRGIDLALWVDDERIAREQINWDPKTPPRAASELSPKERAMHVQAALALLADARRMRIVAYKKCFMLHSPSDLAEIEAIRGTLGHNIFWDQDNQLEDSLASYFGTKVGFYFAWMRFYTLALVFPTIVGLYVTMRRRQQEQIELLTGVSSAAGILNSTSFSLLGGSGEQGDAGACLPSSPEAVLAGGLPLEEDSFCKMPRSWQSPVLPLFNVFLAVWSTLFLEFWKRRQHTLAYRWGVHRAEQLSRALRLITWDTLGPRTTHVGSSGRRASRIARSSSARSGPAAMKGASTPGPAAAAAAAVAAGGLAWQELLWTLRMFVSCLLELGLLGLSIAVMLWFNYAQYHASEKFGERSYMKLLLRVAYGIVPLLGNSLHEKWACFMTEWEGHVTPAAAEDVLVVKLTAFAFVNSYSALFFIAFWERDLERLREMLTTLLVTRAVIARFLEVVYPAVKLTLKKWRQGRRTNEVRKLELLRAPEIACRAFEEANAQDKQHARERLHAERYLEPVELSTEYLEQIVQYGYVTMFAVAFPLAPLLALLNNLAEFSLDQSKLLTSRRPAYEARSGIGAWYDVLEVVGVMSVLTNCMLLSMTAEGQVDQFIPASVTAKFPYTKHVLFVVAAEHLILAFKYLLAIVIDDVPADVEEAQAHDLLAGHDEDRVRMQRSLGLEAEQSASGPAKVHHAYLDSTTGRRSFGSSDGTTIVRASDGWGASRSGSGSGSGKGHTEWVESSLAQTGSPTMPLSRPPSGRSDVASVNSRQSTYSASTRGRRK